MMPETLEEFTKLQILLNDGRSTCKECKARILHKQEVCPQKGP